MGNRYQRWACLSDTTPANFDALKEVIYKNRNFQPQQVLDYGDHGLDDVIDVVMRAIKANKRIALYADYDVDGTMSCVSWIWFLQAIGFDNYIHYIPCRFQEGYGLNLNAIKSLIDEEKAELIITMDTGITANEEAAYCRSRGVEFVCTDHHKIQPHKMPDCVILNPKQHPDPYYQELCGCGITYVLLRKLGMLYSLPNSIWTDLLALTGMATICDVVPLNPVNHKLAKLGVQAIMRSERLVLRRLREAGLALQGVDERDVGFRLGPRINAVGRLEHADYVIRAFIEEDPSRLIEFMNSCNEKRKGLQQQILKEARDQAKTSNDDAILFMGGDWHTGVVGIAASKLAEENWKPVWLFQRKGNICKGSARSVPGFDVTEAMAAAEEHFDQFGGHKAAGGFVFDVNKEEVIKNALVAYAEQQRHQAPEIWESSIVYDCELSPDLATLQLADILDTLKPFGFGFEQPKFCIDAEISRAQFYNDKMTGYPRHTAVQIFGPQGDLLKIMFFNEVHEQLLTADRARFIVSASRNTYRGVTSLSLQGHDFHL